jgi:hypothetical protein
MILLFDMNNKIGYYSKVLKPLACEIGVSTQTLRNWLKQPEIGLKRGFMIVEGVRKVSNQGVNNSRF